MINYKENYNKWLEDNFFDEDKRPKNAIALLSSSEQQSLISQNIFSKNAFTKVISLIDAEELFDIKTMQYFIEGISCKRIKIDKYKYKDCI